LIKTREGEQGKVDVEAQKQQGAAEGKSILDEETSCILPKW
jgi:hypothetical protein